MTATATRMPQIGAHHQQLLIGGEPRQGASTFEVRSPWSGELAAHVELGTVADVEAAIDAAATTMTAQPLEPFARAEILERASHLLVERREPLAQWLVAELGKPLKVARLEVDRAVATFAAAGRVARELAGEVVPLSGTTAGAGRVAYTVRVPVGVVAAITAFNFPLLLAAHKVAPALAAGCGVVVKPADKAPLTAFMLADLLRDAGLPPGWLSVVVADPAATAQTFFADRRVRLLSFTGSARVGWSLAQQARHTRVTLELGGSTPLIVTDTADVEAAARHAARSAFTNAGQQCVSTQRVIVVRDRVDEAVERLREAVATLEVGDPHRETTDVGPLVTREAHDRVLASVEAAVASGAELVVGGNSLGGNVVAPTVLRGVDPRSKIAVEELFGPLLGVIEADSTEHAIAIANATEYGLQAAIFTNSLDDTRAAVRDLDFGSVIVNDSPSFRADPMPYGGTKSSGNTKEGPRHAVQEMTESKLVVLPR